MMPYQAPKQTRAQETEKRILEAFGALLLNHSYHDTTVNMIAESASISHGAFMSRFGSKRAALGRLFELFCEDVYQVLSRIAAGAESSGLNLNEFAVSVSRQYEQVVTEHWGSNRAMHELFLKEGTIDEQTKGIFRETVQVFHPIFCQLAQREMPLEGTFSAVQFMVTLNYNYVLGAMPGLPPNQSDRHQLIGKTMLAAIE